MAKNKERLQITEVNKNFAFDERDFSQNTPETSAQIWAMAQQFPPGEIVDFYGPNTASRIALCILIPQELSINQNDLSYEEQLVVQLNSGTPGLNFHPQSTIAYIRDLSWRLQKSIGILKVLGEAHTIDFSTAEIQAIHNAWSRRIAKTFLLHHDVVERRFTEFSNNIQNWNSLQTGAILNFGVFQDLRKKLPEMDFESRKKFMRERNKFLYGLSQEEALQILGQEKERIEQFPRNQDVAKSDLIEMIRRDLELTFGFKGVDQVEIVGRTQEEDPLLRLFPAYYHPDFRIIVYNSDLEVSEDFVKLVYHEFTHGLSDLLNIAAGNGIVPLLLHRSVPLPLEEAIAHGMEIRAGTLAKFFSFEDVGGARERHVYWRAWADAERNIYEKSLEDIREELEKNVPRNLVQLILDFVEERPGNYLFGYLALPKKVKQIAESKGMREQQYVDWILERIRGGGIWNRDLLREVEQAPSGGPYAELREITLSEWVKIRKLGESLPGISQEIQQELAKVRLGQVLVSQDQEAWMEILSNVGSYRAMDSEVERRKKEKPLTPQQGFFGVIEWLEEKTTHELLEVNAPQDVYGKNPLEFNPAHSVAEWFELLYHAKNHDFVWKSVELQEKILDYIDREIAQFIEGRFYENMTQFPFYTLQKAVKSLKEMYDAEKRSGYFVTMNWDDSVLEKVVRVTRSIHNLGKLLLEKAEHDAVGVRTEQDKFDRYLQKMYGLNAQDVGLLLNKHMGTVGLDEIKRTWFEGENVTPMRFISSLGWSEAYGKHLGLPVSVEVEVSPIGSLTNHTGVAVAPSQAIMYISPDLRQLERDQVIESSIEQDEKTMSFEEVEPVVWTNVVYNLAAYHVLDRILQDSEYSGQTLDNNHVCGLIGKEMMVFLEDERLSNPMSIEGKKSALKMARKFLGIGQNTEDPGVFRIGGIAKAAGLITADDWPESHVHLYHRLSLEALRVLCLSLPGEDPVAVFLRGRAGLVAGAPALGVKDDRQTRNSAYRYFLRSCSREIWKARIESKLLQQPLSPVISIITTHERIHVWCEALRIIFDQEKKLASSFTYGPQAESLPTYLAWRIAMNTGDEEGAQKYFVYNLMRAVADFRLNYGKMKSTSRKSDDMSNRHTTKSEIWQLYTQFLPNGEALDLTTRHVPELRIKPGYGLAYIVDFENWEKIYQHLVSDVNLNPEQAYQALLFLSRYRPHFILEMIEKRPEDFRAIQELWS